MAATKKTTTARKTTRKKPSTSTQERSTKRRKAAMLEALKANLGNVTMSARAANIDKSTHYDWLKKDEAYKAAVEEIANEAIDFVENNLFKAIQGGDTTAMIFYLKTKGKARGYTEKADIDLNGTITIDCGFGDE